MSDDGREYWRTRLWWQRAANTSAGVALATALTFGSTIVGARGLGARGWGSVILALSIAQVIATFLDLTLEEGVVHFGFAAIENEDWAGVRRIMRTAFVVDALIGLAVSGLLVLGADAIASAIGQENVSADLIRIAALVVLGSTIDGTTSAALLLVHRPQYRTWCMAVSGALRLGLLLAAVRTGSPYWVMGAIALANLGGSLIQVILAWRFAWRRWPTTSTERASTGWSRRLIRFGIHSSITTSATAATSSTIKVLVGGLLGARATGLLDVAWFPISAAAVAVAPLRFTLLPEQARLAARGELEELKRSVRFHYAVGIGVAVPGVILGWLLMPTLIPRLYSSGFVDAIEPARLLLVAAAIVFIFGWAKSLPAAVGKPQARTRIVLLEFVLTILGVLLLARYGVAGAAAAISSAEVLTGLAWYLTIRFVLTQLSKDDDQRGRRIADSSKTAEAAATTHAQPSGKGPTPRPSGGP